jgi:CelD/BcsL family acetyltransferase involved in cellulose biosynthesis
MNSRYNDLDFAEQKSIELGPNHLRVLQVEIFKNFEEMSSLQQEWDDFIESIQGEIFLTYDWCRLWWSYYGIGRRLIIYVFRNSGRIVGILPIFWERVWLGPFSARLVKIVSSDFSPVTLSFPVACEWVETVLESLVDNLGRILKWDAIYFGPISGKDGSAESIYRFSKSRVAEDYEVRVSTNGVQSYIPIEGDWEAQIASLSKGQRKHVRRAFRDIISKNITITMNTASEADLVGVFEDFVKMHQAMWQKRFKPGHFKAWSCSHDFHRKLAEVQLRQGRLRLLQIFFNGVCVDTEYIFKFGEQYCWFLNGRVEWLYEKRIDFKWIALKEIVQLACSEGVSCVDAMRGKYEYKGLIGAKSLPIRHIFILPRGIFSRVRINLFRINAFFVNIVYMKIYRSRIAPRFRIVPGYFWHPWIKSENINS